MAAGVPLKIVLLKSLSASTLWGEFLPVYDAGNDFLDGLIIRFLKKSAYPIEIGSVHHFQLLKIAHAKSDGLDCRSKSAILNIVVNRTVPLGAAMTSSPEAFATLLRTPGLVLIGIGVMATVCVLFVIVVTSCVVCRRRENRRRQLDNRRNSRTEALKALTSPTSDNGGAAIYRPEVVTKPSSTTSNVTSHTAKMAASSVANGSASSASAVAGYQPVSCLSPNNNKVSSFVFRLVKIFGN